MHITTSEYQIPSEKNNKENSFRDWLLLIPVIKPRNAFSCIQKPENVQSFEDLWCLS